MKARAADRSAFENAWPRSLRGEGANDAGNLLRRKSKASPADEPRFKSNVERFPTPLRCDVARRRGADIRCARVGSGAAAGLADRGESCGMQGESLTLRRSGIRSRAAIGASLDKNNIQNA